MKTHKRATAYVADACARYMYEGLFSCSASQRANAAREYARGVIRENNAERRVGNDGQARSCSVITTAMKSAHASTANDPTIASNKLFNIPE